MVVILKVVATSSCNGVELMIRQRMAELSASCCQGVVEAIIGIVVRLRLDKTVETIGHLPVTNHDYSYRADTGRLLIGSLEIYGNVSSM